MLLPVFYVRESVVFNKVLLPVFYVRESIWCSTTWTALARVLRERKYGVQQGARVHILRERNTARARVLHERKYDFQQCGEKV